MFNRNKMKGKGIEGKEVVGLLRANGRRVRESKDGRLGNGHGKRPAMMGAHWAAGRLSDRVTATTAKQQLTLVLLMVWAPQAYMPSWDSGARGAVRRDEGLPRSRSHHPMAHGRGAQQPGDKPASVRSSRWSLLERPRQRPSPQGNLLDISF